MLLGALWGRWWCCWCGAFSFRSCPHSTRTSTTNQPITNQIIQSTTLHNAQKAAYLCKVVYEGRTDELRRLLRAKADANVTDYDRLTALHVAAAEGNAPAARLLLEEGRADALLADRWGRTPLDTALKAGAAQVAALLEARPEVTPAVRAAARRRFEQERADELLNAVAWGDAGAARALLERGCPADVRDYDGRTPLFVAAANGRAEAARALLEAGADANARNSFGSCPLLEACLSGHDDVVGVLLAAGGWLQEWVQVGVGLHQCSKSLSAIHAVSPSSSARPIIALLSHRLHAQHTNTHQRNKTNLKARASTSRKWRRPRCCRPSCTRATPDCCGGCCARAPTPRRRTTMAARRCTSRRAGALRRGGGGGGCWHAGGNRSASCRRTTQSRALNTLTDAKHQNINTIHCVDSGDVDALAAIAAAEDDPSVAMPRVRWDAVDRAGLTPAAEAARSGHAAAAALLEERARRAPSAPGGGGGAGGSAGSGSTFRPAGPMAPAPPPPGGFALRFSRQSSLAAAPGGAAWMAARTLSGSGGGSGISNPAVADAAVANAAVADAAAAGGSAAAEEQSAAPAPPSAAAGTGGAADASGSGNKHEAA